MSRTKTPVKFTYDDYRSLPESETKRYELLEGELMMVPSPTEYHQRVSRELLMLVWGFVRQEKLGQVYEAPLDVVLGEGNDREVVQPDLFFISNERSHIIAQEEIRGAPELVVEILSPATAKRDRTYKRTLYARHGVQEYWIVDPEQQAVEVLTLEEAGFEQAGAYAEGDTLSSPLLAGFSVELERIFES